MKKIKNIIAFFFALALCCLPIVAGAQDQTTAFLGSSGISQSNIGSIVATVIQVVLGFLGIIFLVLMFYAGFLWMTAQGNEDQVGKAKDIIKTAVIGLIIIVAAYSITYFVFNALGKASGASGGGNQPIPD